MSTSGTTHPAGDPLGRPGDAVSEVVYPAIWLIFLVFPVVSTLQSEAPTGLKVIAGAAILGFAAAYTASWWWTTPIRSLGPMGNTFAWFLGLFLITAAMTPAIGANAMSTGPFLVAVLAFRLRLRLSVPPIVGLCAVYITLALGLGDSYVYWVPSMMIGSALLMITISVMINREERATQMTHELQLAHQRETIGRDVHDLLGHSLTVITLKTELARKLVGVDPERAAVELDEVLALSREALGEVRATVGQLRTPEWSAQLASARTALRAARIEASLPPTAVEIPESQNAMLAWCLREAVTNVIRHSQAGRCVVEAGPGRLVVTDDGVGTPQSFLHGNGLRGMAERVEEAGGTLKLGPSPDSPHSTGTRLEVLLP